MTSLAEGFLRSGPVTLYPSKRAKSLVDKNPMFSGVSVVAYPQLRDSLSKGSTSSRKQRATTRG